MSRNKVAVSEGAGWIHLFSMENDERCSSIKFSGFVLFSLRENYLSYDEM